MFEWMNFAACLGLEPDLFFPVGTEGPAVTQIKEAKAICAQCPVAWECLNYAVDTGQVDGIWGGTTEDERRAIRQLLMAV